MSDLVVSLLVMAHTGDEPLLMGDSILKRVLVHYSDMFHQISSDLAVSGHKILDLKKLVKTFREKVKEAYVVLLIGTNDVMQGTPIKDMKLQFRSLLQLLRRLRARVLVLELPPIARYSLNSEKNKVVKTFNAYIRSCCSGPNKVSSLPLYNDFLVGDCIDQSLYCLVYERTQREDRIHPNSRGLQIIFERVIEYITSFEV